MAKNTLADLDTTTSNNTDIFGQSTQGTADAKDLDGVDRSILALLARFYHDLGGVVTVGGSANAITVTSASTYQALEDGLFVTFKAGAANTGATTLNLDGLGAKAVRRKGDTALSAGDLAANGYYIVLYDEAYNSAAGAWVLLNPESVQADTTVTLTNKRVTPRVTTITSSGTPTVNTDNCDIVDITALATAITSMTTNLSGTPTVGQVLIFQIKDNGTARAITWGASFTAKGVALPTTTVISKLLTVAFMWNGSNWGCVGSAQEA